MSNFNNAKLTQAIEEMLNDAPSLKNINAIVERSEQVNLDSDRAPWFGIYKGEVEYEPYILGDGTNIRNYRVLSEPQIIVQAFSTESGANAEDRLEDYIALVYEIIQNDKTLKAMVARVVGYQLSYEYSSRSTPDGVRDDFFFQQATITVKVEVRK